MFSQLGSCLSVNYVDKSFHLPKLFLLRKSRENLSKLSEATTVFMFMAMACQEVKFSDFQVYEKIL